MARQMNRLTAPEVRALSKPGRYADGLGLYLQITDAGVKSWILRYQRDGRERWLGLGPVHTFSLAEARERARAARQQIADGIDPIEARKADRRERALAAAKTMTFKEAAEAFYALHEKKWRNRKHREEFLSSLRRYAYDHIGKVAVADIDTGLVLKCIEPTWGIKTETTNRVRGRIERILDWASVRGHRSGENPARWKGHLENVLPARSQVQRTQHYPALPFADLPSFMVDLRKREGIAARALEFTILTAARTGEVIGARWDEIDLEQATWTVPGERMKSGKEHRVPLSDALLKLLAALPREEGNPHVFISTSSRNAPLSNMSMSMLLRRMKCTDIVVHGFRSTFRDWAAERTAYANHVVEMALAHSISNSVERAYRRGDLFTKRRRLMDDWSEYSASDQAKGADVVPLRKKAAAK